MRLSFEGLLAGVFAELSGPKIPSAQDMIDEINDEFGIPALLVRDNDYDSDSTSESESDEDEDEDDFSCDGDDDNYWYDGGVDLEPRGRKIRAPNKYAYEFGKLEDANWHRKFLKEGVVREQTYEKSARNRFGTFRGHFRMPLKKIDTLVELFLTKGWVRCTRHCANTKLLKIRTELLILACLHVLGHAIPFRILSTNTNISTTEHLKFFHLFIDKMYGLKNKYIRYPSDPSKLSKVMEKYEKVHLPGCGGSIDVVHVKWSTCPSGDFNRSKGKESYPSLAFEVVTGFDREIFAVDTAQFGTRNDKHIVKNDKCVKKIREEWYSRVTWKYFDKDGNECEAKGVYFICDGGYLRWPTLISPFKHADKSSLHGYFSTNLESVRKDVECVFGIF